MRGSRPRHHRVTLPNPFARLPMQPLIVVAHLRTPVACLETVMLDALLAVVNLNELRRRHLIQGAHAAAQAQSGGGDPLEIPLPLTRETWSGSPIWRCSWGCFVDGQESTHVWHKRFEDDARIHYRSATPRVTISNGHFRGYAMPLVIRSAPALRWFVHGPQGWIEKLLSAVSHIGKKTGQGYGEVREWTVTPTPEDWSLADPLGRVMRQVPAAMAEARGWTGVRRCMPTQPPYWDQFRLEDVIAPA